ncbi:MAG: trypsin-like peptidase domain-containing protein, partial [Actinobacteria bacterium]|nr:trypsin-like peptidase domain-containing protein [Actinomycetota bacterium]
PAPPAGARTLLTVPDLVMRMRPSVVHIATESVGLDPFGRAIPGGGVGTGFVINVSGLVVTNNHVVEGAQRLVVDLFDGRTVEASVVGRDPQTDLAVIKIDASGLQPAPLGRSDDLQVGESVVAMGHALDLPGGPTVTAGVVSALGRTISNIGAQNLTLSDLIQTDASINPGNSGGPLLNMFGEVVGINSAGAGGSQGISFAIAIDGARPVIEALIKDGRITRGYMGISSATITRSIARQNDLPVDHGVYVVQVSPGRPAAAAGLRAGDILVRINGEELLDSGALSRILAKYMPGTVIRVEIVRGPATTPRTLEVTLGQRPQA